MTRLLIAVLLIIPTGAWAQTSFDLPFSEIGTPEFSANIDGLMSGVRESFNRENFLIASGVVILIGGQSGRATWESCLKAVLVSELVVSPLKYVTGRKRPQGTHSRLNSSFPSSHAATGFAVAAVVARSHPRFRIPAYSLAGLIAYSRVYHMRHHLSDVAAGAAIGLAAAKFSESYLSDYHLPLPGFKSRPAWRIDPNPSGDTTLRLYLTATF